MRKKTSILLLLLWTLSMQLSAAIKLPLIFQNDMVLQRDKPVTIWGFGLAGEKVTVQFVGNNYKATTNKNGQWKVQLPAQKAGGPHTIVFKSAANTIELSNVLFGDVWICGGQSNMQYTIDQIGYKPADSAAVTNPNIRLFTAAIDMDYVPKTDLPGGSWKEVNANTIKSFSATGYFFGKFLHDSLHVPIGLISNNLGATSVETWMSPEALSQFPQFETYYKEYLQPKKSKAAITEEFEKMKPNWEANFYHKGKGFDQNWYLNETDISDWKSMEIPNWWQDGGLSNFNGAVWFRKNFDLPANFKKSHYTISLSQIADYDMVWINGTKVGEGFGNVNWRNYQVPASLLKPTGNVIVVRVFSAGEKGGMYTGAVWGNPLLLGKWLYKADDPIDPTQFPKPHVVNISPFSTPAVLYNSNIAPITSLSIKGAIWYQGESNAGRAEEYREIFPAFIKDWRKQFNQGDFPFLFVQLANYMQEVDQPKESTWAELREAQQSALALPNTGMAVIIDVGEANDIHPKNKMDVGKRLSLEALNVAYQKEIISTGPTYDFMEVKGDTIVIHYKKGSGLLKSNNKYGYIGGFSIAGKNQQFHWAKAYIKDNKVIVYSSAVAQPVAVRYAWSDNPGTTDLYNEKDLPAAPFRTDSFPLSTKGKVFSVDPWNN